MFIWERTALGLIYVIAMSTAAYFRLQSNADGGHVSKRDEGLVFAIILRTMGFLLGLITLTYLAIPQTIEWSIIELPTLSKYAAVCLGASGCLFMYWTLATLGSNLTDTVVTRESAVLITNGPYRFVRHPYYFSALMLMVSASMLSGSWLIAVASSWVWLMLAYRTKREEEFLHKRFGESYNVYSKRVGKFLPRLW